MRLTKRPRESRRGLRARIVLACMTARTRLYGSPPADGKNRGKWRGQFVSTRLEGYATNRGSALYDLDEQVEAIIVKTLETTPPGETHWSPVDGEGGRASVTLWSGGSGGPSACSRIAPGFRSPDPQLVEKIRDVVGLYIGSTRQIPWFLSGQSRRSDAATRATHLPMDFGQRASDHNYLRHGTWIYSPRSMSRPAR